MTTLIAEDLAAAAARRRVRQVHQRHLPRHRYRRRAAGRARPQPDRGGGEGIRALGAGQGPARPALPARQTRCWPRRSPWSARRSARLRTSSSRLGKRRRDALLDRLRERGILERARKGARADPQDTWPAVDSTHEAGVRRELGDVLLRGATPDERTAALVAVLSALDLAHKVVDREGAPGPRRQAACQGGGRGRLGGQGRARLDRRGPGCHHRSAGRHLGRYLRRQLSRRSTPRVRRSRARRCGCA